MSGLLATVTRSTGRAWPSGCERGVIAVAREGDWEGLPDRDELRLLDAGEGTTLR